MKLSTYENPISGTRGDLFNLGNIWAQILGVFVLVLVWLGGQWIADFFFPKTAAEEKAIVKTRIIL